MCIDVYATASITLDSIINWVCVYDRAIATAERPYWYQIGMLDAETALFLPHITSTNHIRGGGLIRTVTQDVFCLFVLNCVSLLTLWRSHDWFIGGRQLKSI